MTWRVALKSIFFLASNGPFDNFVTKQVPVTVCREVEEVVVERVPCRVALRVPYEVRVPVMVCDCPDRLE